MNAALAPLYGLVLAGGESRRMGRDKAFIDYHGMEQWRYCAGLFEQSGISQVFISRRAGPFELFSPFQVISDFPGLSGPLSGIYGAFLRYPQAAWFIFPCDMPDVTADMLRFIIEKRTPDVQAVLFEQGEGNGLPEPLLGIWEPSVFPLLRELVQNGENSPMAVLKKSNIALCTSPFAGRLTNINSPEQIPGHKKGPE